MSEQPYWQLATKRRLSRRQILAGTGAALGGIGLAACGSRPQSSRSAAQPSGAGASSQSAPRSGGTLNVVFGFNPTLDPQKASTGSQQSVGGVYSRLFRFQTGTDPNETNNHDLENDLGISAESPDAVTWTIKLRPDAKFHNIAPVNGHAVEAEDIKATFVRALDPATSDPNRGNFGMVDAAQIQTPDPTTVSFKLSYPYAPFRDLVASPDYSLIYPREVLSGGYDPARIAIGSGAFILDSAQPDVAYTYKKNPDWFEKGRPYVDAIRAAIVVDRSQQLAQWAAGNVDELLLDNVNDANTALQRQPKAAAHKAHWASPYPLYFQFGDPASPFQDLRLRQAASMAIDRDTLSKVVWSGEGEAVVFVAASAGKWSMSIQDLPPDSKPYYTYNPGEAKKLVDAVGATNTQFKLAYMINGSGSFAPTPSYKSLAETVANMLNAAGIKTSLITQDYNKDFVDSGHGSRQGYFDNTTIMFASGGGSDADQGIFSYFDSNSTSNQERLHDPALDAMIAKERTLVNEDERLKAIADIQRYLAQKLYAPSTVGTYYWATVSPRVQNYQYSNGDCRMTETYAKLWLQA